MKIVVFSYKTRTIVFSYKNKTIVFSYKNGTLLCFIIQFSRGVKNKLGCMV